MEIHESYTRSYFNKCHVVMIVYSADVKGSLTKASKCLKLAKDYASGTKLVLVQNKIDLPDSLIKSTEHDDLKGQIKFEFKISAKDGTGTKEMMKKLGKYFIKHSKHTGGKKCTKTIRVGGDDGRPWYSKCSCN